MQSQGDGDAVRAGAHPQEGVNNGNTMLSYVYSQSHGPVDSIGDLKTVNNYGGIF